MAGDLFEAGGGGDAERAMIRGVARALIAVAGLVLAGLGSPAIAEAPAPPSPPPPSLAPALAPVAFLVGNWAGFDGTVAQTGGSARGTSVVTPEAGGAVLLRRDHTEVRDASGVPMGGFDQIIIIYAVGETLHADYTDGRHVILYNDAKIDPGRSVVFTSSAGVGLARFRLTYRVDGPTTLAVDFSMTSPGKDDFQSVAQGHLHRVETTGVH